MAGWWQGQTYTAPGTTIIRITNQLFIKPSGGERYHQLTVTKDLSNYGPAFDTARFEFEDFFGLRGKITCDEDTCTLRIDGQRPVSCLVTNGYDFGPAPLRLADFDRRQVPAALYRIEGGSRLLYLSRWLHSTPGAVDRLFTVPEGTGSPGVREHVFEDTTIRAPVPLNLELADGMGIVVVPKVGEPGNGQWGAYSLEQLRLEEYDIVHAPETGRLVSITRKP